MGLYKTENSEKAESSARAGPAGKWFLWIDETPRPGWANMAIDEALLDRAEQLGECCFRLYTWKPHCLSFGRHEPAARRYEADRIAAMGIDTVRRPTGGRAVWHSRELTYAVAAPSPIFGSLANAYLEIHGILAGALLHLGIPTSLAPRTRAAQLDAGACFAQAAGGEVMARERKVVGSAQLARGSAFLQHGSILLQDEQQLIAALTKGSSPAAFPRPLGLELSAEGLAEAISAAVQAQWAGTWHRISRSDELLQAASQYYPRFRSPAWTWNR